MKSALFVMVLALVVLTGGYCFASFADPPHGDYRIQGTPGYKPQQTCDGTACHSFTKLRFMPYNLTNNPANGNDFTEFCLGCHNAAGEAHDKDAGTPSSNTYTNHTGLVPGNSGVSHSWNGAIGDAGTRVPTATGFSGTAYMPSGNKVRCQTCHNGMDKSVTDNIYWLEATSSDNRNFTLLGYSNTKQYLSQYIRVFRSASVQTYNPTGSPAGTITESRKKKDYLVNYTSYTYNYQTATVTFNQAQASGIHIYAEIGQPYLRVGNAANAMCVDCHNDRLDRSVTHAPGTGVKDSHPVMVPFANRSGLNPTLKASASSNIFIEGGTVECTSCHDPHKAAGKDGMLLRNASESELCTNCHAVNGYDGNTDAQLAMHNGGRHSSPTGCADCHTLHGTNNIMLVRNKVNDVAVNFQNTTSASSLVNGTGTGLCQACHSATLHYTNDGQNQDHHTGQNCFSCHSHNTGFQPVGGCDNCHGQPPQDGNAGPAGWSDTTGGKHISHVEHLAEPPFSLTGSALCAACHGNRPGSTHPENLDTAYINLSQWNGTFSDGGTIGKVDTSDDTCTDVSCHSTGGTRTWSDTSRCFSCHSYPNSTNPFPATGNNHAAHITNAASYNAVTDDYDIVTADAEKCGRCHSGGEHQSGTKDIGSLVEPNLAYDTTSKTCTNACHKNKETAAWGGGNDCNMCHYRSGNVVGRYAQMSGLHVSPSKTWGHYSSSIKVNGLNITCSNCHPNNDADSVAPRNHIKDTDFVKRADMSGAFANVTVTGVGYTKGASIASGTCTKSCHYNPTDPFGQYTIFFKPGQKKRFGDYQAARWSDDTLKCNECHSTPSQEATYGAPDSDESINANDRHRKHMFEYKLNPFNFSDGDKNIYCDDCHKAPDTDAVRGFRNHSTLGENGSGIISLPVKSQNARVSMSFRNNNVGRDGVNPAQFSKPNGVPTCSNVYCHTIMAVGQWTEQACNSCHGTKDGVDYGSGAPGFTNLTSAGAGDFEDYPGGGGAHYSHVMRRGYPCRTCHFNGGGDGNAANHHNVSDTVDRANVDVSIEPQWWFHGTNAFYNWSTMSCENVKCHFGASQNWDCVPYH